MQSKATSQGRAESSARRGRHAGGVGGGEDEASSPSMNQARPPGDVATHQQRPFGEVGAGHERTSSPLRRLSPSGGEGEAGEGGGIIHAAGGA